MASEKEPSSVPSLSNAEWAVMKVIWEGGEMAARDVFAALPAGHGWAYKTVKTLLSRLVAKGALVYRQVGNSYLYAAAHSRDRLTTREVHSFVDRVLDGEFASAISHFIRQTDLDSGQIECLRQVLEEKENAEKEKTSRGSKHSPSRK